MTLGTHLVHLTWGTWLTSSGFGGTAAVVAACIAFLAASRSVRGQRETARKQQWWDRARWALDLTLSEDRVHRIVGLEVLDALGASDFAAEHEFDVVQAAIQPTLAVFFPRHPGPAGPGPPDEADWTTGGDAPPRRSDGGDHG